MTNNTIHLLLDSLLAAADSDDCDQVPWRECFAAVARECQKLRDERQAGDDDKTEIPPVSAYQHYIGENRRLSEEVKRLRANNQRLHSENLTLMNERCLSGPTAGEVEAAVRELGAATRKACPHAAARCILKGDEIEWEVGADGRGSVRLTLADAIKSVKAKLGHPA